VKRITTILAALLACMALGSAAGAQTSAQTTKYNRYLNNHPGTAAASPMSTSPAMGNVADYMNGNGGMQNRYAAASQGQYQRNLQKYNYYLATHPGIANASPYASGYPGMTNYGAYAPTQALASNPIMATLAPILGMGMQNGGGYPGAGMMQPSYGMQPSYAMEPSYAGVPYMGAGAPMGGYAPYGYRPYGGYGNPLANGPVSQAFAPNPYFRHQARMAAMFGNNGGSGRGWGSHAFARHQRWLRNH